MTKTSIIFAFIVFTSSWNATADHHECLSVDSVANFALINHQILALNKRSFLGCLGICQDNTDCHSINYNHVTKICELNARSRGTYPEDFKERPGWLYLDLLLRKPAPPCRQGGSTCRYGFCHALTGSQYPICHCFPSFGGEFCDGKQEFYVIYLPLLIISTDCANTQA